MSKAEWSGWVQAIGAVGAIVAGAIAVWWQVRKARIATLEFQRSEDVRVLSLIAVANVDCVKALKLATKQIGDHKIFKRTIEGFNVHCSALAAIPLLQIPDPWAAMAIARAVQEPKPLELRLAIAYGPENVDAIAISLREFLECERVLGAALAEKGAELPYSKVMLGADVLHEAPTRFALNEPRK